ncbi:MAG: hypothetical protein WCJ09_05050 [Planctomycetota bacterium]
MSLSKVVAGLVSGSVVLYGIVGCQPKSISDNLVTNPGIEETLDQSGMPRGWSFSVDSGNYKHEKVESCQSGKYALVVAGSGGAAEVQTNPAPVKEGVILECEAWVQTKLVKDAVPTLFAKFAKGDHVERSAPIRINPKSEDWQRIRFYCTAAEESTASLVIRLSGEGLVRLDDVSIKPASHLVSSGLTTARTFEDVNAKGEPNEWTHVFRAKSGSIKVDKEAGSPILRMEGNGGWSVLCTNRAITTKPAKIIFQAACRAKAGVASIKLDYIKNKNCFSSTVSPKATSEWTFVTVESDPEKVAESEAIRATLSVAGDGNFLGEFDSVEVFIQDETTPETKPKE